MPPPSWSCSLYSTKALHPNINVKRNQTISSSNLSLVSNIDLNGRNSRWPHHDKGLFSSKACSATGQGEKTIKKFQFQMWEEIPQITIPWKTDAVKYVQRLKTQFSCWVPEVKGKDRYPYTKPDRHKARDMDKSTSLFRTS